MSAEYKACPHCGQPVSYYRNPVPTVDIIIFTPPDRVLLVRRRNRPVGWALPGGFVDYGESAEEAAKREALEETGLEVILDGLLGVYSHPDRDPRQHTLSTVFTAHPKDNTLPRAGDDAGETGFFPLSGLPRLVFDHPRILEDFRVRRRQLEP
ncbi:MAG: NUDIX domain-containing protein [Desulfonatronovibrionaceae bacterium]